MFRKFLSRKLIMTALAGIVAPFLATHGVPEGVITWLIGAVGAYVLGQSYVDAQLAKK